ncbi:hypothetical protein [Chitinophaga cymbidii]|uniref:Apea-like HEPN domain-containing protein n=1 Tax=Chitinophaga cymbidii TaxID=1096750 RepID=A0A512RKB3_9BACT|nr:hypothetical protein [Chitinophaga cymbidii]GEP96153.1 hypothetical protein CCY01nite_24130 [Chitinophaga cymbidii]
MISHDTIEYWKSQNIRLGQINGDDLHHIFDRFTTTFLLYNRLYNEVPAILIAQGKNIESKDLNNDSKKAIDFPLQFLTGDLIMNNLTDRKLDGAFDVLAFFIDSRIYNICFNRTGIHDPAADINLSGKLHSQNVEEKIKGLLTYIYKVRNNVVHAKKHFNEDQRLLLETLTNILNIINQLLFDKMISLLAKPK